jgi:hypothetical protein
MLKCSCAKKTKKKKMKNQTALWVLVMMVLAIALGINGELLKKDKFEQKLYQKVCNKKVYSHSTFSGDGDCADVSTPFYSTDGKGKTYKIIAMSLNFEPLNNVWRFNPYTDKKCKKRALVYGSGAGKIVLNCQTSYLYYKTAAAAKRGLGTESLKIVYLRNGSTNFGSNVVSLAANSTA